MQLKTFVTAATLLWQTALAWTNNAPADLVKQYGGSALETKSFKPKADMDWTATWAINETEGRFYIAIEAGTTGWIGFGIAEAAGMRGADIMVAHVDADGPHVSDYHGVGNAKPILDGCQDWSIHHGEEKDGSTLVMVSRKLLTQDSNDRPILLSGLKRTSLLAAFGQTDDLAYHVENKVKFTVDLKTGSSAGQSAWSAAKAAEGLTFIDLKSNEGSVPPEGGHDYKGPEAGGQLLPSHRTSYWEYCFMDRSEWDHNSWMVAFEAIEDGSPKNVHHTVLYGFDQDGCHHSATESIVWVGGIGFYEDLPEGTGLAFSRVKSFRLQVHYDNPTGASGIRDNSGVRVWLSSAKPTHEAGSLQLGDGTIGLHGTEIPRGRSFFTFTCPGSATEQWPSDITIFGSILHMHEKGDQMYTEVTSKGGSVVTRPNAVEYFDFAFQDPTLVEPYVIHRGDTLTTRCYFHNDRGEGDAPLVFGLGSDEEMCIDFLYYYPYNANMQEHCTFAHGLGGTYDGSQTITSESDPGMRVFGVDAGVDVGTPDDPVCRTVVQSSPDSTKSGSSSSGGLLSASPLSAPFFFCNLFAWLVIW